MPLSFEELADRIGEDAIVLCNLEGVPISPTNYPDSVRLVGENGDVIAPEDFPEGARFNVENASPYGRAQIVVDGATYLMINYSGIIVVDSADDPDDTEPDDPDPV